MYPNHNHNHNTNYVTTTTTTTHSRHSSSSSSNLVQLLRFLWANVLHALRDLRDACGEESALLVASHHVVHGVDDECCVTLCSRARALHVGQDRRAEDFGQVLQRLHVKQHE